MIGPTVEQLPETGSDKRVMVIGQENTKAVITWLGKKIDMAEKLKEKVLAGALREVSDVLQDALACDYRLSTAILTDSYGSTEDFAKSRPMAKPGV